jgi:hypothetical protein
VLTERLGDSDTIGDEELAAQALAADPDPVVAADAVSLWELTGYRTEQHLPDWYMPAPVRAGVLSGWRRWVIVLVIAAFVVIDAYGLCNTYGRVAFG